MSSPGSGSPKHRPSVKRLATANLAITKIITMPVMMPAVGTMTVLMMMLMIRSWTRPGLHHGNIDLGGLSSQKLLAICGNFGKFGA